jgi:regulator of sigma E protease
LFNNFLISVAAMAVVLGIMILVHEFGHFAVAKLLGVRVEQFAIGFGKRLGGFRKGETDYRINVLPLGGYVKMAGEAPTDTRTGDPGEFTSHPRWQRFLIAIAGPTMNIILAVVLVTGVYMVHYAHPAYFDEPAVVGYVVHDSAAAKAGIQAGDRIVRIGEQKDPTWEEVDLKVLLNPKQPLSVAVQRGSEVLDKTLIPASEGTEGGGDAGLVANRPIQVGQVEASMPAAKAGMRPGDVVVAINGQPLNSIEALLGYLEQNKDKPAVVTVARKGQQIPLDITPVKTTVEGQTRYRLGFTATAPVRITRLSFPKALARSYETNKLFSKAIFELVEKLVQGKGSMKQISGPIGIGVAAGQAARQGLLSLLQLTALISLNLGIFNLLPIPILDGGLILLLFVEGLMRRDISLVVKERIYQAAFVFLLLLGVVVIYNDLVRTLPGLAGKMP